MSVVPTKVQKRVFKYTPGIENTDAEVDPTARKQNPCSFAICIRKTVHNRRMIHNRKAKKLGKRKIGVTKRPSHTEPSVYMRGKG